MTALAHFVLRRRRAIVVAWILLTLLGAYSANAVSKRWLEQFSIPGYSAYEANQRTLKTFGTGENAPLTLVFRSTNGDVTKNPGIERAISAAVKLHPGARFSSYFSTGSRDYVSNDGRTMFANIYAPGQQGFNANLHIKETRAAVKRATPPGVQSYVTGRDALYEAAGGSNSGPSVLEEALIGGVGALVILLFVFGTLPAMAMPIAIAIASITLLPALMTTLGHRINRLRVMPKRIVERQDPTRGFWHRWASLVTRRPVPVAALGILIVALLLIPGVQLHAAEAQLKDFPGGGDAIAGRAALASAGISPGVMKPYTVLAEGGDAGSAATVAAERLRAQPHIDGAVAPMQWRKDHAALIEVF